MCGPGWVRRPTRRLRGGMLVALLLAAAGPAMAAPRLIVRGSPALRDAENVFGPILGRAGDSLAVRDALGRYVEQLQSEGYLAARAAADWDSAASALHLDVEPGERYRLTSWRMDATPEDSAAFAPALDLGLGGPAAPRRWDAAIEDALVAAEHSGHPYAMLGVTDFELHGDSATVRLVGDLGPQVTVDSIVVRGLVTTRRQVVTRALGRMTGMAYDPTRARAAAQRLEQLGLFSHVTYEGLEGAPDWRLGRLTYRVEEPRYNQVEAAAGVQGDAGLVGLARLDLGNVAGTGRLVSLAWQSRGRGLTDFAARGAEPFLLGTPVRLEVALVQQLQDTLYTRTRFGVRAAFPIVGGERAEAGSRASVSCSRWARCGRRPCRTRRSPWNTTAVTIRRPRVAAGGRASSGPRRSSAMRCARPRRRARAAGARRRARSRPTASGVARSGGVMAWRSNGAARGGSARSGDPALRALPGRRRGHAARLRRGGVPRRPLRALAARMALVPRPLGRARVRCSGTRRWMATRPALPGGATRSRRSTRAAGLRLAPARPPGGMVGVDYGLEPGRAPLEGKIHLRTGLTALLDGHVADGRSRNARARRSFSAAALAALRAIARRSARSRASRARRWSAAACCSPRRRPASASRSPTCCPRVLLAGDREYRRIVVVATCTRSLQDQLFERDLPALLAALDLRSCGRGSRASRTTCARVCSGSPTPTGAEEREVLDALRQWAAARRRWGTSTASRPPTRRPSAVCGRGSPPIRTPCTAATCRRGRECFWVRARRRAGEARLLIVNHALLARVGRGGGPAARGRRADRGRGAPARRRAVGTARARRHAPPVRRAAAPDRPLRVRAGDRRRTARRGCAGWLAPLVEARPHARAFRGPRAARRRGRANCREAVRATVRADPAAAALAGTLRLAPPLPLARASCWAGRSRPARSRARARTRLRHRAASRRGGGRRARG